MSQVFQSISPNTSLSTCCSGGSDNYDSLAITSQQNRIYYVKQQQIKSNKRKKDIESTLPSANVSTRLTISSEQIEEILQNHLYNIKDDRPPASHEKSKQIPLTIVPKKINVVKLTDWVVNDLWKDAFELNSLQNEDVQYLSTCSFYVEEKKRINISFVSYVKRLKDLTECSDNCFLLALLLFDRLNKKKKLDYSRLNVHKLMAVCLWLSVKFYEDINFTDAYYATKIAGLTTKELISLQFDLLELLNYRLFISTHRFNHFVSLVQSLLTSSALLA